MAGRLASFTSESATLLGRKDKDADPSDHSTGGLMQKCVIIQRDEKGYGFTVSGDNPVFVASVKQDGAAARAGVQNGDRIVKVNGTLVTQRNHMDVVKLIKSGSYVALTLLGKPSPSASSGLVSHHATSLPYIRDSGVTRVTAPQPVDPDKDRELLQQKIHMTRAMYETAKEDVEKLQKQYVSRPSEKLYSQLLEMEKTVRALDNQLKMLLGGEENTAALASPQPTTTPTDMGSMSDSPHTSPSVSPTPEDPHSRHNGQEIDYSVNQPEIIHPEYEDDNSEEEQLLIVGSNQGGRHEPPKVSDPGPFADMKLLENKPAHMAVLLNYLISNSDPSPVLFHIISDLYSRSGGSNKELRKWAYEIFSTFIYKMAPLSISVEDNIISQIDNILASSGSRTDNENVLRGMFQTPRQSVQVEITDQLTDFIGKKNLGMGNLYGIQKIHDNMDRPAEVKVAEDLLLPHLKYIGTEDNSRGVLVDKDLAIGWALATFLKNLSGSKSTHSAALERVQTFMMKDKKSIKFPGSRSSRAKAVKGHQFNLQHFYVTTFCTFCGNLVWGVNYQGYQCQNCDMILHKPCADEIAETCGGKQKRRKLPLTITNRRTSSVITVQQPQQPYPVVEQVPVSTGRSPPHTDIITQPYPKDEDELASALSIIAGISGSHSVQNMVTRFQGLVSPTGPAQSTLGAPTHLETAENLRTNRERTDSSNLNRTASLNNKGKKSERPARRAKSDVDVDSDTFKELHQSASSSASSLSNRSIESPGNSTDNVSDLLRAQYDDPDMDVEPDLPSLKQVLPDEVLRKLKPKEKKRQEVINELFYTERAHLRNLKVLDLLFNRPMYQEKGIMTDLARALFPNMEEMISLHVTLVKDIKERSQSMQVVKDVGDLLLKRFDGEAGERFRKGCAEYCRNQAFALDALKKQTRKEPKLQQFLHDAETNSLCRRLQLKDLVPSQMQRLTKYPLLIDNLLKYTQSQSEEYKRLERAHERCKHILAYVNHAVKECENYHKLKDFQKKLDKRPLEGLNDPAVAELKPLDLTQHKLIFDSPLTWKLRSHRTVDLHVLLFEDLLVLLQKQDDKFVLKCQNTNVQPARDDKYTHSPVLKLQNLLARTLATEKRSFFVVNISESRAQMYEFTAASSELRLKWCKLINEKADEFKSMHGGDSSHQVAVDKNRLSRMQQNSSSNLVSQNSIPATEDIYEVTDQLSRRLDIGDDTPSEGELILPEEVRVSNAVTSEPSTVSSPQATLSPEVSSQEIQPPAQVFQQPSLNVPSKGQLKNMSSELNVILANLVVAVNSSSDEKPPLRRELQLAQMRLDSLKQYKKHITESDASPTGRTSPCVPVLSDIPLMAYTSNIATDDLQHPPDVSMNASRSPTSSNVPSATQDDAELLKEKYGLVSTIEGNTSMTSSLEGERILSADDAVQLQEATVIQLEDSVEHLSLCSDSNEMVQMITLASETSEGELAEEGSVMDLEQECDDSNEVSVADLPLPDPVSIRDHDLISTQHLTGDDLDDSEVESDDYEGLNPKGNDQDDSSSTTTIEDVSGDQKEDTAIDVIRLTPSSDVDTESSILQGEGDTKKEASLWVDIDKGDQSRGDSGV